MRNRLMLLLLTTMSLTGSDTAIPNSLNSNTWSISIGKTELLSWMKQEIGAEVSVRKSALRLSDTLHAEMYFCGSNAQRSISVLTIKNSSDKLLASYPHQNNGMGFEANAPLKGFLNQGATGETLLIYFSVFDAEQKALNRTILLGKLKLQ